MKLLWLAIMNIEDKQSREHTKQADQPKDRPRTTPGKLIEDQTVTGWKAALAKLAMVYPERFNPHP